MVGQAREFEVVLRRDNLSVPWGFRLQGGLECQAPLTVQRVFVGGVSDGQLQRGDLITSIEQYDATSMYHKQAEDLIKAARNTMSLSVRRGGPSYATDYADQSSRPVAQNFQTRQQQQPHPVSSWPPAQSASSFDDSEDFSAKSVAERRQQFAGPQQKPGVIHTNPLPGMPSYVPKRPAIWKKKEQIGPGLSDPGWVPHLGGSRSYQTPPSRQYTPLRPHSPPINRQQQQRGHSQPMSPPPAQSSRDQHYEPPAWAGSLRRSGGPKTWELAEQQQLVGGGAYVPQPAVPAQRAVPHVPAVARGGGEPVVAHNPRLQSVRYGPGASGPVYEQHDAAGQDSDSARVAHLQYNTPIGLYSRQNAEEALTGQTRGKAGYGTMQVTGGAPAKAFDPAQSDVLRMIAAEEDQRKHGPSTQHAPARSVARPHNLQDGGGYQGGPQRQQARHQYGEFGGDNGISDF